MQSVNLHGLVSRRDYAGLLAYFDLWEWLLY